MPAHHELSAAYAGLVFEGGLALFQTGFFGTGAKTYYPASVITAIDRMWRLHADLLPPRAKLNLLIGLVSRQNFHGGVYAKAHNVRAGFNAAFDKALTEVDVLALPTARMVAPFPDEIPADPKAAIDMNLRRNWMLVGSADNTKPTNYTGHPALAVPCGKVGKLPISLQLIGRHMEDALLLRVAHAYQRAVDWAAFTSVG